MSLAEELQRMITAPVLETQTGTLARLAEGEAVPANANQMLEMMAAHIRGLEDALLHLARVVEAQQAD